VFHKAPLSSIIKKSVFLENGGFTNPDGEGDYELWLALSRTCRVLLMPHGMVWYRRHEDQIDFQRRVDPFIRFRYFLVTLRYTDAGSPLGAIQAQKVNGETHTSMVKFIITSFFRYSPKKAMQMYRSTGYNFAGFIKKCFTIIVSNPFKAL
jgi:hypothetical protein